MAISIGRYETLTESFTNWDLLYFNYAVDKQSAEQNCSYVKWFLELASTSSGRISSDAPKTLTVNIGGQQSTHTVYIGIGNNSRKTIASGAVVIPHNADGTKAISLSFSLNVDITFSGKWIGTVSGSSGSITLPSIRRLAEISVSGGYLGQAQTITVSNLQSGSKYSISYKCGSLTDTICTQSTETSLSFTPPLDFSESNITGQSVQATYTITTYYNNTAIGSKTVTVTHRMMTADFAPSCSISVSDPTGHSQTYGSFIKGVSIFEVTVTATPKRGASISSYSTKANDATYTTASFTTAVIKQSGTLTITATVKDSRGFSSTATVSRSVLEYAKPSISKLTVHRCNSDGTENSQGEYVKATFSAAVTPLNNKNAAAYILRYKKTLDKDYQTVPLSRLDNAYAVTDSSYIFAAETSNSYNVELEVTDNHGTATRSTSASTAFTLIHYKADGTGIGFGKIVESSNTVDFGLRVRHSGGIITEILEKYNDLNEVMTPNTYASVNKTSEFYANCPVSSGTFVLEVMSAGAEGQLFQRLTTTFKEGAHQVYCRHYYQGSWGSWILERSDTGWVDLTLKSGISVGTEMRYLKGRLKDGVLYVKGDVRGIGANWTNFASLPAALQAAIPSIARRFAGIYNLSHFAGLVLLATGTLSITGNTAGTWDSTANISINTAICIE